MLNHQLAVLRSRARAWRGLERGARTQASPLLAAATRIELSTPKSRSACCNRSAARAAPWPVS